ncbi:MAG: RnfABCDGE type electron transport complex subunit D, partial [Muribaculaceae bacterium]
MKLTLSPPPHIHTRRTVRSTMAHVLVALIPAVVCALYFFRLPALKVLLVSVAA